MEKNQTSRPKAVCEKIFRAITFGPAFTTIRRLSNRQQTPSSTAVRPSQRPKPSSKQGPELVPIKFDYTTKQKPITAHNGSTTQPKGAHAVPLMGQQARTPKPSTAGMVQSRKLTPTVSGNGKKATQHNHDDRFTAFILETREKIMSRDHQDNGGNSQKVSGHGHGHGHGHHGGSHKDHHFSDYINQTKRKIKSTLSIKDRSESFFK